MGHFFDWGRLKASEAHLAHKPHINFRIITTIFLIMASALFLMRISFLTSSSIVLGGSLAALSILLIIGIYLIFQTRLLLAKLVLLASIVMFQAVEFGHSALLNLTPITPALMLLIAANLVFIGYLSTIKD